MPAFLNWLLRLLPTNPICMRLVQGGSRRVRHLYIRSGYLGIMIIVLLFMLMTRVSGRVSLRELAAAGAQMFELVSYLQVGLICLLTPVFMAGAIAQEANPRTWDILLTTPLNNLQIVLGNLFGRLFFVLALLFSSLPLFAVTQFFGGVPGDSIFASYAIAGSSSLLVAAIAITLSVTRTAGRRAVFIFYIAVVMYLFVTYGIDLRWREATGPGSAANFTTILTPLNPFLALEVLLQSNVYVPHDYTGETAGWLKRLWMSRPISAFSWLCVLLSVVLVLYSTVRLRIIGASTGRVPWYRKLMRLGAKGATERPARHVGMNPIAWREAVARGRTLAGMLGRWGFLAIGVAVALTLVLLTQQGTMSTTDLRYGVAAIITGEIAIIALAALNMSATAVSREREDGTLDIILTTPIQPGPYIAGKLRGLIQYLLPMILVPVLSMVIVAVYVVTQNVDVPVTLGTNPTTIPAVLWEGAIALPIVLSAFIAFCVMVGLNRSIAAKGTIGSVVTAFGLVLVVLGVVSLCGAAGGNSMDVPGAVMSALSPVNLTLAVVFPDQVIDGAMDKSQAGARLALLIGAVVAGVVYSIVVYMMHANMKRTFMMTVRRLAGTS